MEVDSHADGRPVMKGRQKICERRQFVKEEAFVAALDHGAYHVAEQFAFAVFGDQKRVQRIVAAQRPNDVVGIARQPVIAHHAEIVEFARQARGSLLRVPFPR